MLRLVGQHRMEVVGLVSVCFVNEKTGPTHGIGICILFFFFGLKLTQ